MNQSINQSTNQSIINQSITKQQHRIREKIKDLIEPRSGLEHLIPSISQTLTRCHSPRSHDTPPRSSSAAAAAPPPRRSSAPATAAARRCRAAPPPPPSIYASVATRIARFRPSYAHTSFQHPLSRHHVAPVVEGEEQILLHRRQQQTHSTSPLLPVATRRSPSPPSRTSAPACGTSPDTARCRSPACRRSRSQRPATPTRLMCGLLSPRSCSISSPASASK